MAPGPTEIENSFVYLVDLQGQQMFDSEIKVNVEGERTPVINYRVKYTNARYPDFSMAKRFDLLLNANIDAISAVTQNGTLIVSVNKVSRSSTVRSINVVKGEGV
ncbi:hypothetical protein MKX01_035853 [Papaver californicum]|nr:hypothetical protein MKX01_035853 [Papaver californicum]